MAAKKKTTTTRSKPHKRTRDDHASETAEDYVEAVADIIDEQQTCRVGDLAKHFGVSHVTVSRIVGRLKNQDLVLTEPFRPITLTEQGDRLAKKCKRRHQIVYDFLIALGVDPPTASVDSEGIEHHVSPKTLSVMKDFAENHSRQES